VLSIPGKVKVDIRVAIDSNRNAPEYNGGLDGNKSTILSLFPFVGIQIVRKGERDENGGYQRAPWNPNDNLGMTRYNFPIFLEELVGIQKDLKIPELYTYHGSRLELNEEAAAKIRRVFMVGSMTIELSAVVILNEQEETRVEGIKMKFNNEQSSVLLTLNELTSLVYTLTHMDVDGIALQMYVAWCKTGGNMKSYQPKAKPVVDIVPKDTDDDLPF
jgi:hypothetical protein